MRRAWAVARKEWSYIKRTNLAYLVVIQPLLFCFVWGYCASLDLSDVALAVLDQAQSAESRELLRELEGSGSFSLVLRARSLPELDRALVSGAAGLALVVPRDFSRELRRGRPAPVQLVADGTDLNLPNLGLSYATRIVGQVKLSRALRHEVRAPTAAASASVRVWYNPSLRTADFLLLGAVCYNLMWFALYPAMSLLRDKEAGAFAALRATRVSSAEIWLGTVLANGAVALWGTLLQLGLAVYVAGVPFRGSGALLGAGLVLFALCNLNLGCALPLVARRSAHAIVLVLGVAVLAMAFSGYLLPLSCMPAWVRSLADGVPLKHALVLLRAVVQKGADARDVGRELTALSAFAVGSTALALISVRRLVREGD